MARTPKSRQNRFRGFLDMMSEMNRVQEQWMLHSNPPEDQQGRSEATAYVPPSDIFALGDDLIVRCEIPGVKYEDVSVSVASGVLTISGYRNSELDESQVVYYARERVYGAFRRSMMLPEGIDERHVAAKVRNGLLEITIQGAAATRHHSVPIEPDEDAEDD